MEDLLSEIRSCRICSEFIEPNPILTAHPESRIVLIGQAPGLKVHNSGIPWDDKSGDNLREWLGFDKETFYDSTRIALIPMGFCYPGKGKSGDLPPRKECAPLWHDALLDKMRDIKLAVLVGQYAQEKYLGKSARRTLTETVRNFQDYLPDYFVLPHPSPRNNIWQRKNPWFKTDVIPLLKLRIQEVLT